MIVKNRRTYFQSFFLTFRRFLSHSLSKSYFSKKKIIENLEGKTTKSRIMFPSSQKCKDEIIFVFGFGRFHHILISNVILIRNQFYFLRGKILDQLIKEEEKGNSFQEVKVNIL